MQEKDILYEIRNTIITNGFISLETNKYINNIYRYDEWYVI